MVQTIFFIDYSWREEKASRGCVILYTFRRKLVDNLLCLCGQPFLNSGHQCVDDQDENDRNTNCESTAAPEEDILDQNGCHDVVSSDLFSTQQKIEILQKNCVCLLIADPINFDLARFCYSHSKYFQLKQKDHTLGLSMQSLVENIFNQEFDKEMKLHYG